MSERANNLPQGKLVDEEIVGAVTRALIDDGQVNFADIIHVRGENGVVLLSGTVRSAGEKAEAGRVAGRVPGVKAVENELTVVTNGRAADEVLQKAVALALAARPDLEQRLGCTVRDGIVRLIGHVDDAVQIDAAQAIAGRVPGVEAVLVDVELTVAPPQPGELPPDDAKLLGEVALALANANVFVRHHAFAVEGGVATLRGEVASDADRQRAEVLAAAVPGVRAVHNQLRVPHRAAARAAGRRG
jgi:osmotically-inducible protein OsmY